MAIIIPKKRRIHPTKIIIKYNARLLEQCKKMFKHVYLIVGVCADVDVTREKGKPIMSAEERAECVRQCKWVDEVIVNSKWLVDIEYLDKLGCK